MNFKNFFKRMLPFAVTFAVGLFIASFFVSVVAPNFQFKRRGFNHHREMDRRMQSEIEQLRRENSRLRREISDSEMQSSDFDVPPPPPTMPMKTVPYKGR